MSLIFLPPGDPSAVTFGLDSDNLSHRTRKGYVYTVGRNVHPWVATLSFLNRHNKSTTEKAQIAAAVAEARGEENRFIFGPHASSIRGALKDVCVELLTNPTFANGLTGWTVNLPFSSAVQDRVARFTRGDFTSTADVVAQSAATSVVQYGVYVARSFDIAGRGSFISGVQLGSVQHGEEYGRTTAAGGGMKTLAVVIPATSAWFGLVDYQLAPNQAGDFYSAAYTSLSRCLQVDTGPNTLLHSADHENTSAWGALASNGLSGVTADTTSAPDGTTTGNKLLENGVNETHSRRQAITVTSAAQDIACYQQLKAGERGFAWIQMSHAGGSVSGYINLSTGAVTNVGASGTGWSNPRVYAVSKGNGWLEFHLVARKTESQTSVSFDIGMAQAAGTSTYTGVVGEGLFVANGGVAPGSSVPVRSVKTTTAATTGTSPTGGVIHVKGGRSPSEGALAGALLKDDFFEVRNASGGSTLHKFTAPLDLDAAGGGYAPFTPPLPETVNDNAAIIVANPLAKWRFVDQRQMWSNKPGFFSDFELEFEQDLTP